MLIIGGGRGCESGDRVAVEILAALGKPLPKEFQQFEASEEEEAA